MLSRRAASLAVLALALAACVLWADAHRGGGGGSSGWGYGRGPSFGSCFVDATNCTYFLPITGFINNSETCLGEFDRMGGFIGMRNVSEEEWEMSFLVNVM